MGLIKNRLKQLKNKGDPTAAAISLMKFYGWTLNDLKDLTIPQYLELSKFAKKSTKKKKKKSKG